MLGDDLVLTYWGAKIVPYKLIKLGFCWMVRRNIT